MQIIFHKDVPQTCRDNEVILPCERRIECTEPAEFIQATAYDARIDDVTAGLIMGVTIDGRDRLVVVRLNDSEIGALARAAAVVAAEAMGGLVMRDRAAEFDEVTRGVRAYTIARAMNSLVRGVDFRGCAKADLRECYAGEYAHRISPECLAQAIKNLRPYRRPYGT